VTVLEDHCHVVITSLDLDEQTRDIGRVLLDEEVSQAVLELRRHDIVQLYLQAHQRIEQAVA